MQLKGLVACMLAMTAVCLLLVGLQLPVAGRSFRPARPMHSALLASLVSAISGEYIVERAVNEIALERVPGSAGNAAVREAIVANLHRLGWHVDLDPFDEATPLGVKPFVNVVGTLNANATRRLVLAAHYDSKLFEDFRFVAATDSAVAVAMLLHFAEQLSALLARGFESGLGSTTVQLVFFDGEEAFVEWTARDSLYGSRHLAARWADEGLLGAIEVLLVLDLVGAARPQFRDMFDETSALYARLRAVEAKLRADDLLGDKQHEYFLASRDGRGIQDDHVPFVARGVPALHLIVVPFPRQWHRASDDASGLDAVATGDVARIVFAWLCEFLRFRLVA